VAEDERSTATTVIADILDDDDDDDQSTVATQATSSRSDATVSDDDDDFYSAQIPMEDRDTESSSSYSSHEVAMLTKKARLSDEPTTLAVDSLNPWRSSFSSFTLEDIGRLLHGDPSDALILPDVSTTCIGTEPQYKLVGGRMNTTDVVLKPYAEYENEKSKTTAKEIDSTELAATVEPSTISSSIEPLSPNAANETKTITPIDSYFKTSVRVKLTCDSCKYTRHHTETFWQLSLEIGSDHVDDALRRFFAPCRQELKCEKCFCDTATQTMEIEELPPYLLLHFKRFIVDVSSDYSSISYRKDGSPVYFPDRLSLADHDYYHNNNGIDEDESSHLLDPETGATTTSNILIPDYRLISVVHHIGQSASCGHYTADAQRTPGEWRRFNDSCVLNITKEQAIDQSRHTAYMVLYQLEQPTL
jgi:Ubiquitin carboxyl-terminal hydrolase